MSCLLLGIAALLALAVPASIARTSLTGAYVVIVLLAAAAAAAVAWNARARRELATGAAPRLSTALTRIGMLAVLYAVVATVIHATA